MESDPIARRLRRQRIWPEDNVIGLALVVASLEKLATSLGVMNFIWATVVLLGGFASDVKPIDFWFVSIILVVQGVWIFSRRHVLQWQRHCIRDRRTVSWIPYGDRLPEVVKELINLQLHLNVTCIGLSLFRIRKQDYYPSGRGVAASGGTGNLKLALNIFYSLVLSEALASILLMGTTMGIMGFLEQSGRIRDPYEWGANGPDNRYISVFVAFFYYAYSKCIQENIFEGLRTNLICYAEELLLYDNLNEQLRGARMLCNFVTDRDDKTGELRRLFSLSNIYNSTATLMRLVEILGWEEEELGKFGHIDGSLYHLGLFRLQVLAGTSNNRKKLRSFAADILLEFVTDSTQNVDRLATLSSGCVDSILFTLSLKSTGPDNQLRPYDSVAIRDVVDRLATLPGGCVYSIIRPFLQLRAIHDALTHSRPSGSDAFVAIRDLEDPNPPAPDDPLYVKGLKLLVVLSYRREDISDKIVNTPGLLPKIIHFTAAERDEAVVGLSIRVLLNLVRTEGPTGTRIRREVLKNVFILCNLRSIILLQQQDTQDNPPLLNNAMDILMYLAMDDKEARDKIGRVGGIIDRLLTLFLEKDNSRAGKTLYILSLEHRDNCDKVGEYTHQLSEKLFKAVSGRHNTEKKDISEGGHQQADNLASNTTYGQPDNNDTIFCSANILRNIFLYGRPNFFSGQNDIACSVLRIAQHGILQETNELILESYLGLAVAIFKVNKEARFMFDNQTLSKLVELIKSYKQTSVTVPSTRRYAIELSNLMMEFYQESIATFKSKEFYDVVMSVMSTTSELESFYMFSGSIGINPHQKTMHDICMDAIQHLRS